MANLVSIDVAIADMNRWLDAKKVSDKKREAYADNIENLTDAISEGSLILNENNEFEQKLKFPIKSESGDIETLKFKNRLTVDAVQNNLTGVKPTDADGRITAYVSALTNLPKAVIKRMDTEDYSIGQALAIFFL